MKATITLAFMAHRETEEMFVAVRDGLGSRIDAYSAVVDPDDLDTKAIIERVFSDLPGAVHVYPFPADGSFAKARNRMLALARRQKTDYVLWLDPDDPLIGTIPDELDESVYAIRHDGTGMSWLVDHLIRHDADVHFESPVHEYLEKNGSRSVALEDPVIVRRGSGSIAENRIIEHDIPLLTKMIEKDKTNRHAWFCLAQSYRDIGKHPEAAAAYAHRITLGGWAPLVYWCYFQLAELTGSVDDYLLAWNFRPTRVEPLHRLAAFYNARSQYRLGRLFAALAMDIPPSQDAMFVERWVEQYGVVMELAVAQNALGEREIARRLWQLVLEMDDVQPHHRAICQLNLGLKAAA